MTRSTDASMEKLRCSPSSLGSDEDDCGIYAESYFSSTWVYIGDNEELQVWQRPNSTGGFYIDIKQFLLFVLWGKEGLTYTKGNSAQQYRSFVFSKRCGNAVG